MKDLIRKILKEYKEEEKILVVPSLKYFGNDWNALQLFLKSKGNPKWKLLDGLNLRDTPIESLGNLISVGGSLDLRNSSIKSFGNLISVGGNLYLNDTPIESLGNLQHVGRYLNLINTPISKKYTEEEIRQMVDVKYSIYM
jgi:hypothetical protein